MNDTPEATLQTDSPGQIQSSALPTRELEPLTPSPLIRLSPTRITLPPNLRPPQPTNPPPILSAGPSFADVKSLPDPILRTAWRLMIGTLQLCVNRFLKKNIDLSDYKALADDGISRGDFIQLFGALTEQMMDS